METKDVQLQQMLGKMTQSFFWLACHAILSLLAQRGLTGLAALGLFGRGLFKCVMKGK